MIWIESQDNNLFYCSTIKIKMITSNQFLLVNQNDEILGEYFTSEDVKKILAKVKEVLTYNEVKIFTMPKKFEISNN